MNMVTIFLDNTLTKDIDNKIVWGNDNINSKNFFENENLTVITQQEKS